MAGVWMELTGDKALSNQMIALGERAGEVVHRAARQWADDVTEAATHRAPKLTGELELSVHPEVDGGNAEVIADAVNDNGRSYAAYVELGTGHGAAQPYLYPAFAEHRDVLPQVREALAEVIGL